MSPAQLIALSTEKNRMQALQDLNTLQMFYVACAATSGFVKNGGKAYDKKIKQLLKVINE